MKILQINASYKPAYIYGGPTMSVSKLSEELVKAGCDVRVFTTTANGKTEFEPSHQIPVIVDGVPVHYFKRITKDHSHFSPALLSAVWKNAEQFDIVHVHAWWNLASVLACLIAKMRGAIVIVSPRGTLSSYSFNNNNSLVKKTIHMLLGKPLLNRCDVHVTSDHEKSRVLEVIKPHVIHNIPNFIQLPQKKLQRTRAYDETLQLIFLSRVEAKKGLDILFEALKNVSISFHLTIAGDGEMEYISHLLSIANEYGLTDHITWVGFQSDDKFKMLANHDLLVLPSYDENFGNVVIESLAVGTAVLISENVGLAHYVQSNQLGWACINKASAFSEQINQINLSLLQHIRERAPLIIDHDFNETHLVKRYTDMYEAALKP